MNGETSFELLTLAQLSKGQGLGVQSVFTIRPANILTGLRARQGPLQLTRQRRGLGRITAVFIPPAALCP